MICILEKTLYVNYFLFLSSSEANTSQPPIPPSPIREEDAEYGSAHTQISDTS